MISYWEHDTIYKKADFILIGGGITGLNAAIWIKCQEPSANVLILEKGIRGDGASYRNAGFACLGSPTELLTDEEVHGADTVWELVKMRWQGLQLLSKRVGEKNMDLTWCGGTEIFSTDDHKSYEQVCDALPSLNKCFKDITGEDNHFNIENIKESAFQQLSGQIAIPGEGRLHPGKMMMVLDKLARDLGIRILSGVEVVGLEDLPDQVLVHTLAGHTFHAKRVGMATNGFTQRLLPDIPVFPARNQVYLTESLPGLNWDTCLHYHQGYVYARRVKDRILIGGARHLNLKGESTDLEGLTHDIEQYLRGFMHQHFGVPATTTFEYAWSGTLGIGPQKRPIIECTGNNVFAAVRLGGMGIAIGSLVGDALGQQMVGL